MEEIFDLILLILVFLGIYWFYKYFLKRTPREAMTNNNKIKTENKNDIIEFIQELKDKVIENENKFNVEKYQNEYEEAILALDDILSYEMLNELTTINKSNIIGSIDNLNKLQQGKTALNSVMKFISK